MGQVLVDHGLTNLKPVADWPEAERLDRDTIALAVLGIEAGFETATLAVIGEQDILGDRLVRPHAQAPRRPTTSPTSPRSPRATSSSTSTTASAASTG